MHKKPEALSGGQQQRVAIAVALANNPPLLLADEPTGALDRKSGVQVLDLLAALRQRYGLTVLMVTHDLEIAHYADRVLTLRDGALGQDLSHADEEAPDARRQPDGFACRTRCALNLPKRRTSRSKFVPEGVLLRPETEPDEDAGFGDLVPQDAAARTQASLPPAPAQSASRRVMRSERQSAASARRSCRASSARSAPATAIVRVLRGVDLQAAAGRARRALRAIRQRQNDAAQPDRRAGSPQRRVDLH